MKINKRKIKQCKHIFVNEDTGTHASGNIASIAALPITERYTFGAFKEDGKVVLASGNNRPMGVISDVAQEGQVVNVQVFGANTGTLKVLASSDLIPGDFITACSESKACRLEHQDPGRYFVCGIALSRASSGQYVEFTPTLGLEKTISSTSDNT